jgi:DNA-binding response OmpR family regulator
MSGFDVLRRIRSGAINASVPVLVLSVSEEAADRIIAFTLGAVDYISKPFQREELLARVDTHFELSRLRKQLESQAAEMRISNEQLGSELARRVRTEEVLSAPGSGV